MHLLSSFANGKFVLSIEKTYTGSLALICTNLDGVYFDRKKKECLVVKITFDSYLQPILS